jgi:hypothetical protein
VPPGCFQDILSCDRLNACLVSEEEILRMQAVLLKKGTALRHLRLDCGSTECCRSAPGLILSH